MADPAAPEFELNDQTMRDPNAEVPEDEVEKKAVADCWAMWKSARAFDMPATRQIARDRKYASGQAGQNWAVNANILGSYIDILVAYLYARNPRADIRPAEQTGQAAQQERQWFAKTLQLVVERLWKDGKLKKAMKKVVRSGLSVSGGVLKAAMLVDKKTDPTIEHELNDTRDNLEKIRALEESIVAGDDGEEPIQKDVKIRELEQLIEALEANVEVVVRKGLALDFISLEHFQCALDVRDIDDLTEAGWCSDTMFILKSEALEKFPRLTEADLKTAVCYYQRQPTTYSAGNLTAQEGAEADYTTLDQDPRGDTSLQYTTSPGNSGDGATGADGGKPVQFVKAVELWSRADLHIKTLVEGVKRWAREPFVPPYATSRFYPYFLVQFFPVDGERHAQSLTSRLDRLQDEYAQTRSSLRQTRGRSIPGTLFNATEIDEENAKRIQSASYDEFIPLKPRNLGVDLNKLFAAKPVTNIDASLYDTSPIIGDMEKISGVQEALQTSQTVDKTATQAEIEQSGFAARTTAQRDCVEEMLTDLALYTAELALGCLTHEDVVKIAGPLAFWPEGLPPESLTMLLDVDIEAGSTGRPNSASERDTWMQVLPVLKDLVMQAYQLAAGNPGVPPSAEDPVGVPPVMPQLDMARGLVELVKETLSRFDDRIDVERFLPGLEQITNPLLAGQPAPGLDPAIDPVLGQRMPGGAPMPPAPPPVPGEPTGPATLPDPQAAADLMPA